VKRTNYITPAGKQRLQDELNYLWKDKRPKVTQAVSEAAALGDRSENAEYIYGKKQLREIDRRVRFLTKRLEVLKVVDQTPTDISRVFFGAWVELESEAGQVLKFRIVGPDEFDAEDEYISIDSPMARSLLKKEEGDAVEVRAPGGVTVYDIVEVSYES